MRFKAGVLGVCVIIIAIVGTLLGSWVMSMDVQENEVTKYNALTGIEGLFDSELTPTFTDYNPSTNYTGYYTEDSIVADVVYFDGVDYTVSLKPNNYRVQDAPGEATEGAYDLSQLSEYDSDYRYIMYQDNINGDKFNKRNDNQHGDYGGKTVSLADFVTALNTGHDYNLIKLYSTDGLSFEDEKGANLSVDWCVFSTLDDWKSYNGSYDYLILGSSTAVNNPMPGYTPVLPKLSAIVDLNLLQVKLYYDNNFEVLAGQYTLDSVLISIEGGEPGASIPGGYLAFGNTVNLIAMHLPDPQYMDPSKGVSME